MGVEEGSGAVGSLRSKAEVRGYLGSMLRITLSDGRVVIGTFQCMDEHMNFILQGASEKRVVTETTGSATVEKQNCRRLGAVMVPGKHVVKVEVQRELDPDPLIIRGNAP